jgi:hypothetical protein
MHLRSPSHTRFRFVFTLSSFSHHIKDLNVVYLSLSLYLSLNTNHQFVFLNNLIFFNFFFSLISLGRKSGLPVPAAPCIYKEHNFKLCVYNHHLPTKKDTLLIIILCLSLSFYPYIEDPQKEILHVRKWSLIMYM